MHRRKLQFVLMFAACVALLGGDLNRLAICHAHAGGDLPHNHHSQHSQHFHDHAGKALHPHTHATAEFGVQKLAPHAHSSWFGIPVTIPLQNDSSQSEGVLSESTFSILSHCTVCSPSPLDVLALDPVPSIACTATPTVVLISRIMRARQDRMPRSTLLCDTARHERSGVQLS
jgi:hypothetical protein